MTDAEFRRRVANILAEYEKRIARLRVAINDGSIKVTKVKAYKVRAYTVGAHERLIVGGRK